MPRSSACCPAFHVLVHNMRVAAIERLGLGYQAVRAVNPRIVYVVATGFGQAWAVRRRARVR